MRSPSLVPRVALVVDDSMLMRYAVCHLLEQRGFAVESASNGEEALEVLTRVTGTDYHRHGHAEDVGN
jgi:CheY-like chemotaxis protein